MRKARGIAKGALDDKYLNYQMHTLQHNVLSIKQVAGKPGFTEEGAFNSPNWILGGRTPRTFLLQRKKNVNDHT